MSSWPPSDKPPLPGLSSFRAPTGSTIRIAVTTAAFVFSAYSCTWGFVYKITVFLISGYAALCPAPDAAAAAPCAPAVVPIIKRCCGSSWLCRGRDRRFGGSGRPCPRPCPSPQAVGRRRSAVPGVLRSRRHVRPHRLLAGRRQPAPGLRLPRPPRPAAPARLAAAGTLPALLQQGPAVQRPRAALPPPPPPGTSSLAPRAGHGGAASRLRELRREAGAGHPAAPIEGRRPCLPGVRDSL